MQDKRNKLKKELLRRKAAAFDDLGDSPSIHIAKDAKIKKLTVGEKSKSAAGQPFAEEIICVTHRPTHSSQQKPGTEVECCGVKERPVDLLLTVWTPMTYTGDPQDY